MGFDNGYAGMTGYAHLTEQRLSSNVDMFPGGHALPGPVDVVYSRPPPWVQTPTPTPSSQARGGPVATALPSTVNIGNTCFIIESFRSRFLSSWLSYTLFVCLSFSGQ